MADYWNHNTAYHGWILRVAAEREGRDVLDVGCGDGLLLQRLAPLCRSVGHGDRTGHGHARCRTEQAGRGLERHCRHGRLRRLVVGLAANRTLTDWVLSGLVLQWVRLGSLLHREAGPGTPVTQPGEGLDDIRDVAEELLPGARIRRGLYYRYLLRWSRALNSAARRSRTPSERRGESVQPPTLPRCLARSPLVTLAHPRDRVIGRE